MEKLQWLQNNWAELAEFIAAALIFAEVVVKFTPTKNDDSAVERFGKLWSKITQIFPSNVKK